MNRTECGLYADSAIFDILYTPGTAREVDVLQTIARRFNCRQGTGSLWLEPACGTGRYIRRLAGRGQPVNGFDILPDLVAYAQASIARRQLQNRARVRHGDMIDFSRAVRAESIDYAFNPVNSIRHLDNDRSLLAHLAQIARVLRPGAVYAVGLSLLNWNNDFPDESVWEGTRGRCRVRQIITSHPPSSETESFKQACSRTETLINHLVIERPSNTDHCDFTYTLRTYTGDQWRAVVKRSPLELVASLDAQGMPLAGRTVPYQYEILAQNPSLARLSG